MADHEVQRAAVEDQRVGVPGRGGVERTDLDLRPARRCRFPTSRPGAESPSPLGFVTANASSGRSSRPKTGLNSPVALGLIADHAFDARQLLVAAGRGNTDADEGSNGDGAQSPSDKPPNQHAPGFGKRRHDPFVMDDILLSRLPRRWQRPGVRLRASTRAPRARSRVRRGRADAAAGRTGRSAAAGGHDRRRRPRRRAGRPLGPLRARPRRAARPRALPIGSGRA